MGMPCGEIVAKHGWMGFRMHELVSTERDFRERTRERQRQTEGESGRRRDKGRTRGRGRGRGSEEG